MKPLDLTLYVVTDPVLKGDRPLEEVCLGALEGGATALQLRDKQASTRSLLDQARLLLDLCRRKGALFLVNDRVDVALAAGAHGVHLGQEDMPLAEARKILGEEKVIGISVRTPGEARAALEGGADYVAANLVFPTSTKTDLEGPLGLEGIRALRAAADLPLVAIGGIHEGNAASVVEAGADGVAVVSAVMAAPDPKAAAERIRRSVIHAREARHGR